MKIARLLLTITVLVVAVCLAQPGSKSSADECPTSLSYGDTVQCSITEPGEIDSYTFSGTAGERVIARLVSCGETWIQPYVEVHRPDGTLLCSAVGSFPEAPQPSPPLPDGTLLSSASFYPAETSPCLLDATGTHTILASDHDGTRTGGYNLHLLRTTDPVNATPIAYGQTLSGTLTIAAAYDAYTFSGTDGERVIARVDTPFTFCPYVKVYRPDGTELCWAACDWIEPVAETDPCLLDATGAHAILVGDLDGDLTGSYSLQLSLIPPVFDPTNPTANPAYPVPDTDDPVNTASGDFRHVHTDLTIPGRGVPLEFTRYYHSGSSSTRSLGYGWTHSYDMYLVFEGSDITVFYPQGHATTFVLSDGVYVPPPGIYDTLVQNPDDTYTLTTVNQVRYNFSSSGVLTSIVDRNDNTTSLTYTGGLLTSVTDPGGRSLTLTYDPSDRIETVTDPLLAPDTRAVEFAYDANGDLEQVTDVKGGITTYAYSDHRMTSLTDANGHVAVQNTYDSADRVAEQQNAVGDITCIYYGTEPEYTSAACPGVNPAPTTFQTIVVDPRGNKTTYTFDAAWRATDAQDHLGGIVHYDYDANNNLTCLTDQRVYKTAYSYDSKGNVTEIIDALNTDADCQLKADGVKWTFSYTPKNDLDLETDPLGRQSDYVYDTPGNLTRIIRKDEAEAVKALTCLERDDAGQLTGLMESTDLVVPPGPIDPCTGHKTEFEYDQYGNLTAVVDPRFSSQLTPPKTTFTYDLGGRMLSVTNELDEVTDYTYDAQNNLLTVEDNLDNTTTYTYDAKGSLKTITDANGKLTTYNYDDADRLTEVIDALSQTTSYGYDANGNRTSVTNARGKVTTYAYDALNRLQSVIDPLDRVTSYQYDAASNLTQRTDARGLVTEYIYDGLSRLTRLEHWEGETLVDSVEYTYDAVGNRLTMTDPTGTSEYAYDALNRPTSVSFPGPRVVSYLYDNVGNRSRITYPDGKYVDYTYDEAHNMETVTDWLAKTTAYTYDDAGKPTNVAYPVSGFSMTYGYDPAGRLDQVIHSGVSPQTISYTLDAVGNRTSMQVDSQTPTTYQYDSLYRLTSVSYPEGDSTTYSYDPVGNRLSMFQSGVGNTTYTYDDADQLASVTPPGQPAVSYSWDNNGNLTGRGSVAVAVGGIAEAPALASSGGSGPPLAAFAVAGGLAVIVIVVAAAAWRAKRRGPIVVVLLVLMVPLLAEGGPSEAQARPAATPVAETFTYDHENRVIQAVIGGVASSSTYDGDGLRMRHTVSGVTTNYTWDVARGLPVVLQDGSNTYVYGLDLISTTDNAGAQTYHLYDGLGSTTDLVDGSGNSVASYDYDVFGAMRRQSGSSPNYWLFTSEQRDGDSDLYYLRARYYDPSTGRFLTADPFAGLMTWPQSLSRYPYVVNNPTTLVDPSGLYPGEGLANRAAEGIGGLINKGSDTVGDSVDCALHPRQCSLATAENVANALECLRKALPHTSTAVQLADLVPLGPIPVLNVPLTVPAVALDVAAFGFAEYEIVGSSCSGTRKKELTIANVLNLGFGLGGQGLSVLASPTVLGSWFVSTQFSAVEGTLYWGIQRGLSECDKE